MLAALNIRASGTYLDATYGRGGHAGAILEKLTLTGRLLCLDRDSAAVAQARVPLRRGAPRNCFSRPLFIPRAVRGPVEPGLKFDGMLFDLGVSSPQIDDAARGFSFMQDGPLDMRMTPGEGASAADVVNGAPLQELIRIFREYGEERLAPRIARAIVKDRELAAVRDHAAARRDDRPRRAQHGAPQASGHARFPGAAHPCERRAPGVGSGTRGSRLADLAPQGRLAVISFHSLEDRMVKQFMRRHASRGSGVCGSADMPAMPARNLRLVGKSVRGRGSRNRLNPRARSARLRVAERLPEESPHEVHRLCCRLVCRCCGSPSSVQFRAGHLCAAQGARPVRAAREAQCRARSLDMEWGRIAARTELLVLDMRSSKGSPTPS